MHEELLLEMADQLRSLTLLVQAQQAQIEALRQDIAELWQLVKPV